MSKVELTSKLHKIRLTLVSMGYTAETLQATYDNGSSKKLIVEAINQDSDKTIIAYRSFIKIWEFYGLIDNEKDAKSRQRAANISAGHQRRKDSGLLYGKGYTTEEIISFFDSGLSLEAIYRNYGVSPQTTSKIVKVTDREVRRDIPSVETLVQLEEKGITKQVISRKYYEENCSYDELMKFFSEALGRKIGTKATGTVLLKHGIRKSKEGLRERRAAKSKLELKENLAKLKRAGYSSPAELAKHYDTNLSLTKRALIRQLNSTLTESEEPFTERWLARHMDPHLSEGRLKGTSRVEKEFTEILKSLTTSRLITGSFSIIPPYQLDTYLPDLGIAIEFNGDHWHSDKFLLINHNMTSLEYHTMKLQRCNELGIELFFIWESDWYRSQDYIISLLKEILENPSHKPKIFGKLTMEKSPDEQALAA